MRSGVDEARDLRCLGINNQRACGLGCGVANSGLSFFWEVRAAGGGGGGELCPRVSALGLRIQG